MSCEIILTSCANACRSSRRGDRVETLLLKCMSLKVTHPGHCGLTGYKRGNGALDPTSKIRRPEFIRSFSPLLIRLYFRREDRCTICVKCEKQARCITLRFRPQPLERLFGYKEWPLHCAVMTTEPNGTSGWIEKSALVWKVEHRPGYYFKRKRPLRT